MMSTLAGLNSKLDVIDRKVDVIQDKTTYLVEEKLGE
jgi:hypothetical protein